MALPKNQKEISQYAKKCNLSDIGELMSPILWSMTESGKYNKWQIIVGAIKKGKQFPIDLDDIYERQDIDADVYYYTVSGLENGKLRISGKTPVKEGKNTGKANATTPLTQAVFEAMGMFNKRIKKGNTLDKSAISKKGQIYNIESLMKNKSRGNYPWRVHAMALHDYSDPKLAAKIGFPCYVQPKLDGIRFIVVSHPDLPLKTLKSTQNDGTIKIIESHIDGYSRGRETLEAQDSILIRLSNILKNFPKGIHLDGELWKKGYGLQDISGTGRRKEDSKLKSVTIHLEYYIFDCFMLDKPELPWIDRMKILEDISAYLSSDDAVHIVKCKKVENQKELKAEYRLFLKEKYEGAVIRASDSKYEFGIDKEKRSYKTLKFKPRPDAEWPVVGFEQGEKGKAIGAVKWICTTTKQTIERDSKKSDDVEEQTFTAIPNWPDDVKYKVYSLLTKNKKYFTTHLKGKMVTIQYSILSNNFVPQQPKMLYFKDVKLQEKLFEDAS